MPFPCKYCHTSWTTTKALNTHLSKKPKCRIRQQEEIRKLTEQFRNWKPLRNEQRLEEPGEDANDIEDGREGVSQASTSRVTVEDYDQAMAAANTYEDEPAFVWQAEDPIETTSSAFAATVCGEMEGMEEEEEEEEEEEQDVVEMDHIEVEYYGRQAGIPIATSNTRFEQWRAELDDALYKGAPPPFSPTLDDENWELANWLMTSGLSSAARDNFLKMPKVRKIL
jgi:hypothetical protein